MNLTLDYLGMPGPGTARGAQIWLGILVVGYIAIRGLVALWRKGEPLSQAAALDGATFAGSVMVGVGAFDPDVLKAIGDTTLFLIIAAVVGISYTVKELCRGR